MRYIYKYEVDNSNVKFVENSKFINIDFIKFFTKRYSESVFIAVY